MSYDLKWPSRGFLAGVALSAPFAANPYPTVVAALLLLPLIIDLFVRRIRMAPFFKPTLLHLVIVALAACHVAAILLGTTPYSDDVLRNLIWSGGVVGVVLLASDPSDRPQDIILGFFTAAAVTAVPIAVAGLVKYGLQLNGVLFGSLINTCFGRYPQGTTFCGDYNLFSLYIGIAALGASALILCYQSRYKAILLVCLAIILAAGLFAGSRRFAAIAVLVAIYWAAHAFRSPARTARLAIVPLALTALLYAYYGAPRAKIADEEVVTVEQVVAGWFAHTEPASRTAEPAIAEPASPIELLEAREPPKGTFGPVSTDETGQPRVLAARDVSPVALASTFEDNYGFGSRLEKWKLG
ncbi:hypothetical protein [Pseudaminobacter sp. NGMCC 1.201702]|uniref:hypothetical protein n=1 Tax=Pseudaminobacter sp. NGMCC 1.201702 TaxID=3391825 RepID=UPI0039F114DE